MIISEAQADNGRAFIGGGPGALISGVLWRCSFRSEAQRHWHGLRLLFLGGHAFFPLSLLVSRILFGRTPALRSNPLGRVALESTIAMIGGLFAAWLFLTSKPEYVFPVAAIAIGTDYAACRTVYGDTLFWALAGLVTAVGVFDILGYVRLPGGPALAVGLIEIAFGPLLTLRGTRDFTAI